MSAKVASEAMPMLPPAAAAATVKNEVESVTCECCRLTEDYTRAYIHQVQERYHGRWICGLCADALEEERRSEPLISTEEALDRHMSICRNFISAVPANSSKAFISAWCHLVRRSLDSPRAPRSVPSSPSSSGGSRPKLARTGSCFSRLKS